MSGLSIVIPSHGREELLGKLLRSIASDADGANFPVEIIVVDDTRPPNAVVIEDLTRRNGARYVRGGRHVGRKRNLGVSVARYDLILFLDSDVVIRPGTLSAHHAALGDGGESVAGCLGKVEFVGRSTLAWETIAGMQLTLPFAYADVMDAVPWGPTANLSFRKTALLEAGGFDETLPEYGGEDVDLGLRLTRAGRRIVTSRSAIAEHSIDTWSTWSQNLRRLVSFGRADYYLMLRHPDRTFFDFPTAPLLLAMQAIAGALIALVRPGLSPARLTFVLALSLLSYHIAYAAFKRQSGHAWLPHLLGPVIFYTMDLSKTAEALRYRRPGLVFCRLKFLDDLIAQDWREIASSAWGLAFGLAVFWGFLVAIAL